MSCVDCGEEIEISIHAPTRGATRRRICLDILRKNFNPRSHEGSDQSYHSYGSVIDVFQSTLPRGERLCNSDLSLLYLHFNPRSHEGSDCKSAQKLSVFYTLLLLSLHNLMNNYNTFSDNI